MKNLKIFLIFLFLPMLVFAMDTPKGWIKHELEGDFTFYTPLKNPIAKSNGMMWTMSIIETNGNRYIDLLLIADNMKDSIFDIFYFMNENNQLIASHNSKEVNDSDGSTYSSRGQKDLAQKLLKISQTKGTIGIIGRRWLKEDKSSFYEKTLIEFDDEDKKLIKEVAQAYLYN